MRFKLHKRSGQKFRRLALNRDRQMEKASPRPFSPLMEEKRPGLFPPNRGPGCRNTGILSSGSRQKNSGIIHIKFPKPQRKKKICSCNRFQNIITGKERTSAHSMQKVFKKQKRRWYSIEKNSSCLRSRDVDQSSCQPDEGSGEKKGGGDRNFCIADI